MSDEIDAANDLLLKMIDAGIKQAQGEINMHNESGHCIWCGEPVNDGRRWCSADCRNDYERINRGN
jgi:hypothetical protein